MKKEKKATEKPTFLDCPDCWPVKSRHKFIPVKGSKTGEEEIRCEHCDRLIVIGVSS